MNDTTKPAAKAVAIAHKAPSRATIDTAQDELANLNYKLGRAQVAAMLSSGQAKADRAAVEELTALVEEKRQAVEAMVETFTNPTRSDPAVALDAIRSKLGQVDQANAPGAPGDPVAAAKPHDGGPVKQGVAYMVGEKTGEAIIPRVVKATVIDSAGDRKDLEIDLDKPIQAGTFKPRAYNVEDPESLNWGNDAGAPVGAFALVDKIENVQPGDVEIPDTSTPEPLETVATKPDGGDRWRTAHQGKRPPADPEQGTLWIYRAPGSLDRELFFDTVSGWSEKDATDPTKFHQVKASDLTADFWEAGELEQAMKVGLKPRGLFSFGRG